MLLFVYNSVAEFVLKSNSKTLPLICVCMLVVTRSRWNLTYPKLSIHLNHLRLYCRHLRKLRPRQDKFFWLLLTSLELGEAPLAGGGGGIPLHKLYRYVPPHRVGFLRRFGLKTGIHLAHFGLESGMRRSPFSDSDFFKQGPAYKKDGPDRERI